MPRRGNRLRSIQASLAILNNTLTIEWNAVLESLRETIETEPLGDQVSDPVKRV